MAFGISENSLSALRTPKIEVERLFAITFAFARTVVCAWRAAHQSITHDEAFSYLRFIYGPWSSLWSRYDAANHVLYSFLAKVSVTIFGLSELALRLPAAVAGVVVLWGLFLVLETCESRLIRGNAYVAIGLHPSL